MTAGRPRTYKPEMVEKARRYIANHEDFDDPVPTVAGLACVSGIYGLLDPRTGYVRYVGRSKNIKNRYYTHLRGAGHLPVACWVRSLKAVGLKPKLAIIEETQAPETKEAHWIREYREKGQADLNLHDGGAGIPMGGSGKCADVWSVEGMPCAFTMAIRTLWKYQRLSAAKEITKKLKTAWASCRSETDRINVQLNCVCLIQRIGSSDAVEQAERWLLAASAQINQKYKGRIVVVNRLGIEVAA